MKKFIVCILLSVIISCIIYYIFKIEINLEKNEIDTFGKISEDSELPIPNRIVYKRQNGKYVIIDSDSPELQYIYNELYRRTSNITEGKIFTEEEISKMQDKGCFIEFDYNRISKNFIFMLEETEIGIIKRLEDGGQVIATNLEDKENLIQKVENWTKDMKYYDFNQDKNITLDKKIEDIPNYIEFKEVQQGIYQKIIDYNEYDFQEAIETLEIESSEEIPSFNPNRETVVITLSRYEIKNIKQSIGNIKYEFGNYQDEFFVNILVVSKVVNTNCIYYEINNTEPVITENLNNSNDEYAAKYYMEEGKYYSELNNQKVEIISDEKACDIADMEAKNSKYQYQPWKSEFYSRGYDKKDSISAELISNLSSISKFSHWNEEWKVSEYKNKLMWKVRLFDQNDPLTSLYIYVDAINGKIIGAGASSD